MGQNITIDKMLPGFRGKCELRRYIPSKPSKYRIKIFAVVDWKAFYTGNHKIYAGTQPEGPYLISSEPADIINRLAEPIYSSGHNITADNWFTGINLISNLKKKWLSYVGTVCKNKPQLPPEFVSSKNGPEKSSLFAFGADSTLVSHIHKKEKKNVVLVSSMHFNDAINLESQKPDITDYYNQMKSGVDTVDRMTGTGNVARSTRRGPMAYIPHSFDYCSSKYSDYSHAEQTQSTEHLLEIL